MAQNRDDIPDPYQDWLKEIDYSGYSAHNNDYYLCHLSAIKDMDNVEIIRKLDKGFLIVRSFRKINKSENYSSFKPLNNLWKKSSNVAHIQCIITEESTIKVRFERNNVAQPINKLKSVFPSAHILYMKNDLVILKGLSNRDIDRIIEIPEVTFVDVQCVPPKQERIINGLDLSTNGISRIKSMKDIDPGKGVGVVVQEDLMDVDDLDLLGKVVDESIASPIISTHATNMSTIIAGRGNSYYLGEGVADQSLLMSSDFRFLLPPELTIIPDSFRTVNHSYGTLIENNYGLEAREYDSQVSLNTDIIHVFSAGNTGNSLAKGGIYDGLPGYANMTGNFKQAKNIMTVGSTDSLYNVEIRSSRGPAYDGRVKPDFVAYGEDGSSGAAAIASGLSAILQSQYYNASGLMPRFDLIKSILMASSRDVESPGPDYVSGYGALDGFKAIKVLNNGHYFEGSLTDEISSEIVIEIPSGTKRIRLALAWIDAPSREGDTKALVKDLDLSCTDSQGNKYIPLILETSPDPLLLSAIAAPGIDSVNNAELIVIDNPPEGPLIINITAANEPAENVLYSIAYSFSLEDTFEWMYPTENDILFSESSQILRWENPDTNDIGILSWKKIEDDQWADIGEIKLDEGYYYWHTPAIFEQVQLRMETRSGFYLSDTITIAPDLTMEAINLCGDELLLQWDAMTDASAYQLYHLENNEMVPFLVSSDPLVNVDISREEEVYFAVKPVGNSGQEGRRSITINYKFQNPPCYIKKFSGRLDISQINLELELSILEGVSRILIIKVASDFREVILDSDAAGFTYSVSDPNLLSGFNTYEAQVILEDGTTITSEPFSIEYIPKGVYTLLQNPVPKGDDIVIIKNENDIARIEIYNIKGNKLHTMNLPGNLVFIDTTDIPSGNYPYYIVEDDVVVKKGIIIIL